MIIGTCTVTEMLKEENLRLNIAQSSTRPNKPWVDVLTARIAILEALPPQNTIWVMEDETWTNLMD